PDAHLFGEPHPGLLEAALAGLDRLSVRLAQGGDRHQPGRRHRRRAAYWRAGRAGRAPAERLLLWPDHPDLVGPGHGRPARDGAGRRRRLRRAFDATPDGRRAMIGGLIALAVALAGGVACVAMLDSGAPTSWYWLVVLAVVLLGWRGLETLAQIDKPRWMGALVVPGLFGVLLLWLWQVLTTGFDIPPVLLPSPAQIGRQLAANPGVLWQDFRQTFLKSVLAGFILGSAAGFIVALLVDRSPFLQRGLLPLGSLVSAIPIVGIAPIMVMWFGFDWQSKAAVIVVMTFFPMLINTLAGLAAADDIERDLMHSYAAGYGQTLTKLRLP